MIKYISNAMGHGYDLGLDDIDDTQNGLLLHSSLHYPFGSGSLAPLKVHQPLSVSV